MAIIDNLTKKYGGPVLKLMSMGMYMLGICLTSGLYILIGVHTYAFFTVIAPVLRKRLGIPFGLLWCAIGLSLLYNICFNHLLAMLIGPGCPKDLYEIEKKRK
jgi:hypothetical protein